MLSEFDLKQNYDHLGVLFAFFHLYMSLVDGIYSRFVKVTARGSVQALGRLFSDRTAAASKKCM